MLSPSFQRFSSVSSLVFNLSVVASLSILCLSMQGCETSDTSSGAWRTTLTTTTQPPQEHAEVVSSVVLAASTRSPHPETEVSASLSSAVISVIDEFRKGISTLHLRSRNIDEKGARALADAMSSSGSAHVTSFSMSYNPIGDDGCIALVAALPSSLSVLGMVSCGIGDGGGESLVEFVERAQSLTMICVENNQLPASVKARLQKMGSTRGFIVVV